MSDDLDAGYPATAILRPSSYARGFPGSGPISRFGYAGASEGDAICRVW